MAADAQRGRRFGALDPDHPLLTGCKLCAPMVWKHMAHIGSEQLFVFAATVLVTVTTDLLWGIAAGIAAKLLLELAIVARVERGDPEGREPPGFVMKRVAGGTGELVRNPVGECATVGDTYHIYFGWPLVCFNSMQLESELSRVTSGVSTVCLHVTDLVTLIDHTTATLLLEFVDNVKRTGRGIATIVGLDRLKARSHADAAMRISPPLLAQERAKALERLARISPTRVDAGTPDSVVYLERLSLTHVGANQHPTA